ncbi:hypothetical protein H4219_005523 [Mycoemilia scoparia]|uniref:Uncharacterized protein n=1 Tax=Mycoemilia scoparia TaxID=417184 RepID=A0A9W7ZNS1_9FUNG|nr:hypothetical protein H4219_005523 [Mycoemilia scoparia]
MCSDNPTKLLELKLIQTLDFETETNDDLQISKSWACVYCFVDSTIVNEKLIAHKYGLPNGLIFNVVTSKETGKIDEIHNNCYTEVIEPGENSSGDGKNGKKCPNCNDAVMEIQSYVQVNEEYACAQFTHLHCIFTGCVSLGKLFISGNKTNYPSDMKNLVEIIGDAEGKIEKNTRTNIW